jgi:hypothetical protein
MSWRRKKNIFPYLESNPDSTVGVLEEQTSLSFALKVDTGRYEEELLNIYQIARFHLFIVTSPH